MSLRRKSEGGNVSPDSSSPASVPSDSVSWLFSIEQGEQDAQHKE